MSARVMRRYLVGTSYVITALDAPRVGVLVVMPGLLLPVRIADDGAAMSPYVGAVAGTVVAFTSEANSWQFLAEHMPPAREGAGE